jgi:hypothetical protein
VDTTPHVGRRHRGRKSAMLGGRAWRENQTRCQETERDLKKTKSPTPHTLILDLCRTTVLAHYSNTENGLSLAVCELAGAAAHTGMASSGIGLAVKNLRVYRESQRAPELAFLRRALSVLMPVPAYILR